jgi:hypothetical protein
MTEDTRDVIEQIQSRSVDYTGKELSPQEMAADFAKWDILTRVKTLQDIQADAGELSPSEAARRHDYERALRNTHEILRKVGR